MTYVLVFVPYSSSALVSVCHSSQFTSVHDRFVSSSSFLSSFLLFFSFLPSTLTLVFHLWKLTFWYEYENYKQHQKIVPSACVLKKQDVIVGASSLCRLLIYGFDYVQSPNPNPPTRTSEASDHSNPLHSTSVRLY